VFSKQKAEGTVPHCVPLSTNKCLAETLTPSFLCLYLYKITLNIGSEELTRWKKYDLQRQKVTTACRIQRYYQEASNENVHVTSENRMIPGKQQRDYSR